MSQTDHPDNTTAPSLSVETVLEGIPDAVVVADVESGEIVEVNDAAGELFGCPPGQLVGRHHAELHPGEDVSEYYEAFVRGFEDGQVTRLQDGSPLYVETVDGKQKPVEINTQRIETDGRVLVLGVFREASDRLARERELESTSERLETLLGAAPLPVAVLDTSGIVERWNRAAEETYGYSAEEIVGKPYSLFVDDSEFEQLFSQVIEGGLLEGHEAVHRAKDGSRVNVELYARPLLEDGSITGIIGTAIDISDRKHREQQLDVLHRVLRHNLRNQLTIVQSLANELARDALNPEAQREAAQSIVDASERLSELSEQVKQTRQSVRAARQRTRQADLAELLSQPTVTAPSVSLTTPPSSPEAVTVPEQSERAFTWLLECIKERVEHTDIAVRIRERHVELEIRGHERLLPDGAEELITNGQETALRHGGGFDIAQVWLVLRAVGGDLRILTDTPPCSRLQMELPRTDAV